MTSSVPTPCWDPFELAAPGEFGEAPRSVHSLQGVGDRLRAAAFAELQAREAFHWAAEHFVDAPAELREAWRELVEAENRHLGWLLQRMKDLQIDLKERKVSDRLWYSLVSCKNAEEFAIFIASAEERGRKAGVRVHEALREKDPITAEIFKKIADEEVAHVALTVKFYPHQSIRA